MDDQPTMIKRQENIKLAKKSSLLINALHLIGLWGLAIAQPLYALMSKNAEFFVAYRMQTRHLLGLVFLVSFGLPLLLVALEWIMQLINRRFSQIMHYVLVYGLTSLALFPFLKTSHILQTHDVAFFAVALVSGAVITAFYIRTQAVFSCFSFIIIAAILFPIVFLGSTGIRPIAFPTQKKIDTNITLKNPPTIVFILFDEFRLSALLDKNMEIDPVRFPNIARLVGKSYWFPRATTMHHDTLISIPSILAGTFPTSNTRLPIESEYPNNIFTLLANNYDMHVEETLTRIFPEKLKNSGSKNDTALTTHLGMMISDLSIIYLHVMLPEGMRNRYLPAIDSKWNGFMVGGGRKSEASAGMENHSSGQGGGKGSSSSNVWTEVGQNWNVKLPQNYRKIYLENFLDKIKASPTPTLHFLHILLPHSQYEFLPSGALFAPPLLDLGKNTEGVWSSQIVADVAYQAYLLQVGFCDRFVGQLIQKLKNEGLYENSLIVLTADHGVSFQGGVPYRRLTKDNYTEILPVPLIIKLPHQQTGVRSEIHAETTDILPTIADALGVKIPWAVSGQSLLSKNFPARETKVLLGNQFDYKTATSFPDLKRKFELFGSDTPLKELTLRTGHQDILGHAVSEFPYHNFDQGNIQVNQYGILKAGVNLAGGYLPLYITGAVMTTKPLPQNVEIAISVNGTIRAITFGSEVFSDRRRFRAVLPESSITSGSNMVHAYLVERKAGGGIQLQGNDTVQFELIKEAATGSDWIKSSSQKFMVKPGSQEGYLQVLNYREDFVEMRGWAINATLHKPSRVLLFADGQFYAILKGVERPDIANWKGKEYLQCGFNMYFPLADLQGKELSLFAISDDGTASELNYQSAPDERILFFGGTQMVESDPKNPHLQILNGPQIPIKTAASIGGIEALTRNGDYVNIKGWIEDSTHKKAPNALMIFQNGNWVRATRNFKVNESFSDDANSTGGLSLEFNCSLFKESLFQKDLPSTLTLQSAGLRVFAMFDDQAVELKEGINGGRASKPTYHLTSSADGLERLITPGGRALQIQPRALRACVQDVLTQEKEYVFRGWAINEAAKQPVEKIVLLADGQYLGMIEPNVDRSDIAGWLGQQYLKCGFEQGFPKSQIQQRVIRVFALSKNIATECDYPKVAGGGTEVAKNEFKFYSQPKAQVATPSGSRITKAAVTSTSTSTATAASAQRYRLNLDRVGTPELILPDGKKLGVKPGALRAILQQVFPVGSEMVVRAWVIDEAAKKPADKIVIFSDGKFVGELTPNVERQDIADWLGKEYLKCGYEQGFAKALLENHEIRVIAISGQTATECQYPKPGNPAAQGGVKFPELPKPQANVTSATVANAIATPASERQGGNASVSKGYTLGGGDKGNPELTGPDGGRLAIKPGALRAILQQVFPVGSEMVVRAWAIDEAAKKPVDKIVIFSDGKFVGELTPNVKRQDIADWLGKEYLKCGFEQGFAKALLENHKVQVFAISGKIVSECTSPTP